MMRGKVHGGGMMSALFMVLIFVSSIHAQHPQPSYPIPEDGASDQSLFTTLAWWESASQERVDGIIRQSVYFSSDRSLVEDESFSALVCDHLRVPYCDPTQGGGPLHPDTTYFWKVRVVEENGEDSPISGDIWSFTTTASPSPLPCFTSLALPLGAAEMDILRRVRDEVLAATPEGRRLIHLYYSPHAVEALVIAFCNPRLRVAAYRMVQEVLPLLTLRLKEQQVRITSSIMAHADALLVLFARDASPAFRQVIERLREDLMQGSMIEHLGFSRER